MGQPCSWSGSLATPVNRTPHLRMKNIILFVLIAFAGWYGYSQYPQGRLAPLAHTTPASLRTVPEAAPSAPAAARSVPEAQFKCDARIYCSQMTSCAEATYFLRTCPGTKMDGDNDGIPCERQWCG